MLAIRAKNVLSYIQLYFESVNFLFGVEEMSIMCVSIWAIDVYVRERLRSRVVRNIGERNVL